MSDYFFLQMSDDPNITGIRDDGSQAEIIGRDAPQGIRFISLSKRMLEASWRGEFLYPSAEEFEEFSFKLRKSAKAINFLRFGPYFFSGQFLLDPLAYGVFKELRIQEHRTYPVKVSAGMNWLSYWMFCARPLDPEIIDFKKSSFYTGNQFSGRTEIRYQSHGEYKEDLKNYTSPVREPQVGVMAISDKYAQSLDLVRLPISGRVLVSKQFKSAAESAGCLGCDFFPVSSGREEESVLIHFPLF